MKKRLIIALCIAPPALLALALTLSLTIFKANPLEETDGRMSTGESIFTQPVKEQGVNPPAKGQKSETPDGEPEPGGTPPTEPTPETPVESPEDGKTPVGNPDDKTTSVNEEDRIPIASPSLLTDETTGKGVISLGDHVDYVRETLKKYKPTRIIDYRKNKWYRWLICEDVEYEFDEKGYLQGYVAWNDDETASFETLRGLKMGDPVSRVFELYGREYYFESRDGWSASSYIFVYENTYIDIMVENDFDIDSDTRPTEGDESAVVCDIRCSLIMPGQTFG